MRYEDLLLFLILISIFDLFENKQLECLCNDSHTCLKRKLVKKSVPKAIVNEAKYLHPEISQDFYSNETQASIMSQLGVCHVDSEGKCYTAKLFIHMKSSSDNNGAEMSSHMIIKYGCISTHEHSTLTCKSHLVKHEKPKTIACCNSSSQCNFDLDPYFYHYNNSAEAHKDMPIYATTMASTPYKKHILTVLIILVSGICFAIFTVAFCIFCLIYRKKFHHMARQRLEDPLSMATTSMTTASTIVSPCQQHCDSLLLSELNHYERSSEVNNTNNTSGSGSGPLILAQRTVGKQLSLDTLLGQGRFGQVWLGEWRGQEIAVKLFHSGPVGEGCWRHEIALHWRVLLRHPNVLSIAASDRFTSGSIHRPLLVTEYMPRGSLLQCFINRSFHEEFADNEGFSLIVDSPCSLSILQIKLLKIAENIVSGLDYLHTEISGTYGKPGIAHRDLKPSNIYVKSDWSCCIGDFSLAVTQQVPLTNQHLAAQHAAHNVNQIDNTFGMSMIQETEIDGDPFLIGGIHASTARYMAPEILGETVNCQSFEDFKKADIYSLGLIFWELIRWCAPVELLKLSTVDKMMFSDDSFIDLPYYPVYQDVYLLHYGPPKLKDLMTSSDSNKDVLVDCEWNPDDDQPTVEEMNQIVCTLNKRPELPAGWTLDLLNTHAPVSYCLSNLMRECWTHHNHSRLTSLRVKKNLRKFHDERIIVDSSLVNTPCDISLPANGGTNC